MKSDNESIMIYVSIAVIIISLFFIGMGITGYATTDTGVVNVSITSSASIVFTTTLLDFGNGTVNTSRATLDSEGTVTGGTWAATSTGLVLENNGNVDVNLTLATNDTVANFIGGTSPTIEAKITQVAESGSCNMTNSVFDPNYAGITTTGQLACVNFSYLNAADMVEIEINLTIPSDALGAKTVGIVATATAI
mgnify:CR=1 FL=1